MKLPSNGQYLQGCQVTIENAQQTTTYHNVTINIPGYPGIEFDEKRLFMEVDFYNELYKFLDKAFTDDIRLINLAEKIIERLSNETLQKLADKVYKSKFEDIVNK